MVAMDKGSQVPTPILEFSRSLPVGMITPLRCNASGATNGQEFVEFVGRDVDEVITSVKCNPTVEISLGILPFSDGGKVILSWLFIKLSGDTEHLYEIGLNLADPQHRQDLEILSRQPMYEIVLCGESCNTITRVSLPELRTDIEALLRLAKHYSALNWSQGEYFDKLASAQERTSGPAELLELISRGGLGFEEILGRQA